MTFLISFPSRNFSTLGSLLANCTAISSVASKASLIDPRVLPLIWTPISMVSSTKYCKAGHLAKRREGALMGVVQKSLIERITFAQVRRVRTQAQREGFQTLSRFRFPFRRRVREFHHRRDGYVKRERLRRFGDFSNHFIRVAKLFFGSFSFVIALFSFSNNRYARAKKR